MVKDSAIAQPEIARWGIPGKAGEVIAMAKRDVFGSSLKVWFEVAWKL